MKMLCNNRKFVRQYISSWFSFEYLFMLSMINSTWAKFFREVLSRMIFRNPNKTIKLLLRFQSDNKLFSDYWDCDVELCGKKCFHYPKFNPFCYWDDCFYHEVKLFFQYKRKKIIKYYLQLGLSENIIHDIITFSFNFGMIDVYKKLTLLVDVAIFCVKPENMTALDYFCQNNEITSISPAQLIENGDLAALEKYSSLGLLTIYNWYYFIEAVRCDWYDVALFLFNKLDKNYRDYKHAHRTAFRYAIKNENLRILRLLKDSNFIPQIESKNKYFLRALEKVLSDNIYITNE